MTIKIHDWDTHQTYRKDRGKPPWVKVHRDLMMNQKWAVMSDAEKGQLISMWIVAADKGGYLPDDPAIISKICQLDAEPNINRFKELGLIDTDGCHDDVTVTSRCQPNDAPDTDTDTDTDTEEELEGGAGGRDNPALRKKPLAAKRTAPRKRGTRIPDGYDPDPELWSWAAQRLPQERIQDELDKFRDYWSAQPGWRGVKLDWDATFRNWIRRASEER